MDRGDSNGAALKKSSETTVFMRAHRAILFFRVTFCPTIFHPITSFLFLTIVLLACMILFLALFFVFRADLCVLFFLLRVYTRVYICFMWFCYIKACVSSCIFSRLLLLLLLRFFRHDSLFYIPLLFSFHCVLCLISLLHRYDTSRCQLYYGGHKGGVGRASQQHVGGDPPRI